MSASETRIDPDQWGAAVADVFGPQLVVAGPGTGKTEFLVQRIIHLIEQGHARPEEIQFLTFSRRSAADARSRILAGLPRSVASIGSSTFHSFARRLLETFRPELRFELLTGPEQVALVSELLSEESPTAWPAHLAGLLGSQTLAADLADFLLRCAERSLTPEDIQRMGIDDWKAIPGFMTRYRAALAARSRLDYAQLLAEAVEAVEDSHRAAKVADQFRFMLVDEYQDTSPAQARLLEVVSRTHRNITAAGDPYQSVYSFRGADLGNIAAFPDRFRDQAGRPARRIVLTTSHRVPAQILEAALRVTHGGGLPGEAGPVIPAPHRGSVETYVFDQSSAEADWIASEVERLHLTERIPYSSIAVLLRSKRTVLPELSRALTRRRIPHDLPDARLVDHPAVQLVFDLARFAARDGAGYDPELDSIARRLLLGPLVELPLAQERYLLRLRRNTGVAWAQLIAEQLPERHDLSSLLGSAEWAISTPASDGFWHAWEAAISRLALQPGLEGHRAAWTSFAQVLERLRERDPRVTLLEYWTESLADDFEATPLISFSTGSDRLVLTTLHQSKGLEFDTVFIADADDAVFPDLRRGVSLLGAHRLSGLTSPTSLIRFRVQEEMRLAYTAMCRARRRVVWTATAAGIDEGDRRPSRFLLLVAQVADRSEIGPPAPYLGPPTTLTELEVLLRRTLTDPEAPAAERLAAATVLARHWDPATFAGALNRGPDHGVIKADATFSPSQAEAYATCPRRYVLERRLGIGDTSSSYAHFGTLVHEVLERAERRLLEDGQGEITIDRLLTELEAVWAAQAEFGSPVVNEAQRVKAENLLRRLADEWPSDARRPVMVEKPLELVLDGNRWRGRADRIDQPRDGILRIVDHKTSKSIPSREEAAASLQLGFYLLAARADPEVTAWGEPAEAEFWYPQSTLKDFRRRFDPDRLGTVEEELIQIARNIRSEDWSAVAGAHCERCSVRLICPVWPEGQEAFVP